MSASTADQTLSHEPNTHEQHFPASAEGKLLYGIAVAFSLFQIGTAAHLIDMPSQLVRSTHVA
ncbi:MAG: hypothetical protein VX601_07975, partial [Pseudomonadota bacterium]|nr:hypothetical protein [Pseudomonadota bacterium]